MKDQTGNNQLLNHEWLSMSEAAAFTPYSAEYLSLLARKKKLSAKKVGKTWYTTRATLDEYMKRQMIRNQVQNGDLNSAARIMSAEPADFSEASRGALERSKEFISEFVAEPLRLDETGTVAAAETTPAQVEKPPRNSPEIQHIRTYQGDLKKYLESIEKTKGVKAAEAVMPKSLGSFKSAKPVAEPRPAANAIAPEKNIAQKIAFAPVNLPTAPISTVPVAKTSTPASAAPQPAEGVPVRNTPSAPEFATIAKTLEDISKRLEVISKAETKKATEGSEELTRTLSRVLDEKLPHYSGARRSFDNILSRSWKTVRGNKVLAAATLAAVLFFSVFPVPFVHGFFDKTFAFAKSAWMDANTVMGFRPGTHENEVLLLDREGNISIMGHVETEGQFRSFAADGIAPIVVDSKTEVKNLNVEMVGGTRANEFTLAFVTKNGSVTTENVTFDGEATIGRTLLVRGATKLLSTLEVEGDLSVFGEAKFAKSLSVSGPAYFESVLNATSIKASGVVSGSDMVSAGNMTVGKNGYVRGSLEVRGDFSARNGSIRNLGVSGDFSADGEIELGNPSDAVTIDAENITFDEDGNMSIDGDLNVGGEINGGSLNAGELNVGSTTIADLLVTGTTTVEAFVLPSLSAGCLVVDTFGIIDSTGAGCGSGPDAWATSSSDFWASQRDFFSTTSADYWKAANDFFSTTSSEYFLSQNQGASFSTTSANYWDSTISRWSTTSSDYFASVRNFFSTTSALYLSGQTRDFSVQGDGYLAPTTSRGIIIGASSTISELTVTSGTTTYATSTGFFATLGRLTTGVIDTLTSTAANITSLIADSISVNGLTATRSTTTNATTTRLVATAATTTDLYISGTIRGAGLTSCSGSADKLIWNSVTGQFSCGADAGAGGGITAVGAEFSTYQTGATQTFATTSDANITLTITSAGDVHTFTPGWTGTLADGRVADDLTISGGTINSTPIGTVSPSTGVFTFATSTAATTTNLSIFNAPIAPYYIATSSTATSTYAGAVAIGTTSPFVSAPLTIDLNGRSETSAIVIRGNTSTQSYIALQRNDGGSTSGLVIGQQMTAPNTPFINASTIRSAGGLDENLELQPGTNRVTGARGALYLNPSGGVVRVGPNASGAALLSIGSTTPVTDLMRIDGVAGNSLIFTSAGGFGIGTTSPFGRVAITGTSTGATNAFVVANSNNATLFNVLNNGNVGIGTTTPGAKFAIGDSGDAMSGVTSNGGYIRYMYQGDIRYQLSSNGVADFGLQANGANLDAGALRFGTGNSATYISGGGSGNGRLFFFTPSSVTTPVMALVGTNVGIGTTSPFARLSVVGNTYIGGDLTATGTVVFTGLGTGLVKSTAGVLSLAIDGTDFISPSLRDWSVNSFGALAPTTTRGIFVSASSTIGNGTEGLTVYGAATTTGRAYFAGNVGIATSAPASKLEVSANGISISGAPLFSATGLALSNNNIFGVRSASGNSGWTITSAGGTQEFFGINPGGSTNPLFSIYTGSGTFDSYWVPLNATSNFGFGTTSPSNRVTISDGTSSVLPLQRIENYSTGDAAMTFALTGIQAYTLGIDNSDGDKFKIGGDSADVGGTNFLTITPAGSVGIGTTSPFAKLSVAGSAYIGGDLTATGTTGVQGLSFTLATGTSATTTNLFTTNLTATNLQFTNLVAVDSTTTNATTTTFFSTIGRITTGVIDTLTSTAANITTLIADSISVNGLTATRSTTTAATTTNLAVFTAPVAPYYVATSTTATSTFVGGITGPNSFTVQQSSGRVGIGITNPSEELDVIGTVQASSDFRVAMNGSFRSNNSTGGNISLGSTTANVASFTFNTNSAQTISASSGSTPFVSLRPDINQTGTAGYTAFLVNPTESSLGSGTSRLADFQAGGVSRFAVLNTGNVGIASSTPWALLSINPSGIAGPAFAIGSSTATKFLVTNGGSVGIGTAAPSYTLDVQGANGAGGGVQLRGKDSSNNALLLRDGARGLDFILSGGNDATIGTNGLTSAGFILNQASNGPLMLNTNNIERVRIDASGNVGIGTSTPVARLSVYNSSATVAAAIQGAGNGAVGLGSVSSGAFIQGYTSDSLVGTGNITIQPSGSNTLINPGSGSVGIGTTSPFMKLSVGGSAYIGGNLTATGTLTVPTLSVTGLGPNMLVSTDASSNIVTTSTPQVAAIAATSTTATSTFAGGLAVKTNAFVVDSSTGRVMIGATSPISNSLFTVRGGSIHIDDGGSSSGINLTGGSASNITSQTSGDSIDIRAGTILGFHTFTSGSFNEKARFSNAGFFGLGTTSPFARLSVAGDAYIGGNLTATGTVNFAGSSVSLGTTTMTNLTVTNTSTSTFGGTVLISNGTGDRSLSVRGTTGDKFLEVQRDNVGNEFLRIIGAAGGSAGGGANNTFLFDSIGPNQSQTRPISWRFSTSSGALYDTAFTINPLSNITAAYPLVVSTTTATSTFAAGLVIDTNTLVVDSGGNKVGVGTSTPVSAFSVNGGIFANGISSFTAGPNASNGTINLGVPGVTNGELRIFNGSTATGQASVGFGSTAGAGDFGIFSGGGSGRITLSTGQAGLFTLIANAGVGTTSPWARLSVNGAAGGTAPLFAVASSTAAFSTSTAFMIDSDGDALFANGTGASPAISFIGDTDTGFLKEAADRVAFSAGGAIRTYFDTVSIQVPSGAAVNPGYRFSSDTTSGMFLAASNQVAFSTGGTERVRINASGSVGIGTSTPVSMLHVVSADDSQITVSADTDNANEDDNASILLQQDGNLVNGIFGLMGNAAQYTGALINNTFIESKDTGGGGGLQFVTGGTTIGGTNGTARMTITQTGNVGIGTTSAAAKLQISGTSVNPQTSSISSLTEQFLVDSSDGGISIYSNEGGSWGSRLVLTEVSSATGALTNKWGIIRKTSGAANPLSLTFGTNADVALNSELYTFGSTGNFGIGTTTPGSPLSVAGNGYLTGGLTVGTFGTTTSGDLSVSGNTRFGGIVHIGTGGNRQPYLARDAGTGGLIVDTVGTSGGDFIFRSIGTELFRILGANGTGNVGIGTTTPFAKLSVAGDAYIGGNLTATGTLTVSGGFTTTATSTASVFVATDALSTSTFAGGFVVDTNTLVADFSTNNVGIGTTSPTAKLAVVVPATNAVQTGLLLSNPSTNTSTGLSIDFMNHTTMTATTSRIIAQRTTNANSNSSLQFWNFFGGSLQEAMRVSENGYLGIGTTTPINKLSVVGSSATTQNINTYQQGISDGTRSLSFGVTGVSAEIQSAGSVPLYLNPAGTNNVVLNLSGGNTGVGTSSPFAKLSVAGAAYIGGNLTATGTTVSLPTDNTSIQFANTGTNGQILSSGGTFTISNNAGTANTDRLILSAALGDIAFRGPNVKFQNAAGSSEWARFNSTGNFGIGTSTVNSKLQVYTANGGSAIADTIRSTSNWSGVGSGSLFRFTNGISTGSNPSGGEYNLAGIAGIDDTGNWGGSLAFYTAPLGTSGGANLAERVRITNAGNFGIGTTSAFTRLSVAGSAYIGGNITATGTITTASLVVPEVTVTYPGFAITANTMSNQTFDLGNGSTTAGVVFEFDFKTGSSDTQFLLGTTTTAGDFYWLTHEADNDFTIRKRIAGVSTLLASGGTPTWAANEEGLHAIVRIANNTINWTVTRPNGSQSSTISAAVDTAAMPMVDGYKIGFVNVSRVSNFFFETGQRRMLAGNTLTADNENSRIGIGTTSPVSKLSIQGTAAAAGGLTLSNGTDSHALYVDSSGYLVLSRENEHTTAAILVGQGNDELYIRSTGSGGVRLNASGANALVTALGSTNTLGFGVNGAENVRIATNGFVGFGTTSPLARIEVNTSSSEAGIRVTRSSNSSAYLGLTSQYGAFNQADIIVSGTTVISPTSAGGTAFGAYAGSGLTVAPPANGIIVSGSVGIGTSTPGAKLNVFGASTNLEALRLSNGVNGPNSSTSLAFYDATVNATFNAASIASVRRASAADWDLSFSTGQYAGGSQPGLLEKMRITAEGDVGIGTSTPGQRLVVEDSGSSEQLRLVATPGSGFQSRMRFVSNAGYSYHNYIGADTFAANNVGLIFQTGSGSANTRMVIDVDGDVGIGTTTPNAKLVVLGDGEPVSSTNAPNGLLILSGEGDTNTVLTAGVDNSNSNPIGWIQARHANSGPAFYPLALNPNGGTVGIGTTTPGARLHIQNDSGGSEISGLLIQNGNPTAGTAVRSIVALTDNYQVNTNGRFDTLATRQSDGSVDVSYLLSPGSSGAPTSRLYLDGSTGNIGIGTTTPDKRLSVQLSDAAGVDEFKITDSTGATIFTIDSDGNTLWTSTIPTINFANANTINFNDIDISDPGAGEGLGWSGTTGNWIIDVSPLDRSNADGNLNLYNSAANNIAFWRPTLWVSNSTNYATASSTADGGLNFTTTGSGNISLNPGGRVGVGTTTPMGKLSVVGSGFDPSANYNAAVVLDGAYGGGIVLEDTAYSGIWAKSNGTTLNFSTGGTGSSFGSTDGQMILTSTGRLGIGTTTIANKLAIWEDGTASARITGSGAGGPARQSILFLTSGSNENRARGIIADHQTSGTPWFFGMAYSADAFTVGRHATQPEYPVNSMLYITSAGSVGIGTSTPAAPLHVNGNVTATNGVYRRDKYSANAVNDTFDILSAHIGGSSNIAPFTNPFFKIGAQVTGVGASLSNVSVHFFQNDTASGSPFPAMTLEGPSGDLGIGTTTPLARLSVSSYNYGATPLFIIASSSPSMSTSTAFIVNQFGNVGIGTTTPGTKLEVAGDITLPYQEQLNFRNTLGNLSAYITQTSTYNSNELLINNPGDGPVTLNTYVNGNIGFRVNGTEAARVTSDRDFVIGTTTSAEAKLTVASTTGTVPTEIAAFTHFSGGGAGGPVLAFRVEDGTTAVDGGETLGRISGYGSGNATYTFVEGARIDMVAEGAFTTASAPGYLSFSTTPSGSVTPNERFRITSAGNVGIGTTSPYARLSVVGEVVARNFTATSTTATSTFAGGLDVGSGALRYDYSSGLTTIDNLELGALVFDTDSGIISWADMPVTGNATAGTVQSYTAQIDGNALLTVYAESNGSGGIQNPRIGVGSTTPWAQLSVNATGNTGPSFAIGSSTRTDFIVTNAGNVGIGTTSPYAKLSVAGETVVERFTATSTTATSTIAGFLDVLGTGANATSTFSSNLWVKGTLRTGTGSIYMNDTGISSADGNLILSSTGSSYFGNPVIFNNASSTIANLTMANSTSTNATSSTLYVSGQSILAATSGNVGIGTTSPSTKIDVYGTAKFGLTAPQGDTFRTVIVGERPALDDFASLNLNPTSIASRGWVLDAYDPGTSAQYFQIYDDTNNLARLTINNAGNVGIGTSTPATKLEVVSAISSGVGAAIRLGNSGHIGSGDINGKFEFVAGDPDHYHITSDIISRNTGNVGPGGGGAADLVFRTAIDANSPTLTDRLTIKNSGNIGIGTSTPATKLDVDGGTNLGKAKLDVSTVEGTLKLYRWSGVSGVFQGVGIAAAQTSGGTPLLKFQTSAAAGAPGAETLVDRMVINNNGLVGIGTTSPAYLTDIYSTSAPSANPTTGTYMLRLHNAASWGSPSILFTGNTYHNTGSIEVLDSGSNTGNFSFKTASGGGALTERMRIMNSGNIGIGTSTPTALMTIDSSTTGASPSFQSMLQISRRSANRGLRVLNYNGDTGSFATQYTQDFSTWTDLLAYDVNNGRIGVGTSTPQGKLAVVGDGIYLDNNTSANGIYFTTGGGTARMDFYRVAGINDVRMKSRNGGVINSGDIMTWDYDAGRVGVATNTPWALLSVNPDTLQGTAPSFAIGSSTKTDLIVTNAGLVGIGTTSPSQALSVNGTIYTTSGIQFPDGSVQTAAAASASAGTTGQIPYYASAGSSLTATSTIFLTTASNVGIGTSTPSGKLHIHENSGTRGEMYLSNTDSVAGEEFFKILFNARDSAGNAENYAAINGVIVDGTSGSEDGRLNFETRVNGSSDSRLTIAGSNVGIGTTTPQLALGVAGRALFTNSDGDHNIYVGDSSSNNRLRIGYNSNSDVAVINAHDGAYRSLYIDGSVIALNPSSSGNVGIGTTSPAQKLDIYGGDISIARTPGTFGPNLYLDATNSGGRRFAVGSTGSGDVAGGSKFNIFDITASAPRLVIDSSGNVGIGTTSPTDKLQVDVATNKEIRLLAASSSGITDVSTAGAGLTFSRAHDGADNISGIFTYSSAGGDNRLAVATRDDLVFASGGGSTYSAAIERMRITSSGNVGIGTSTPVTGLHVNSGTAGFPATSGLAQTSGTARFSNTNSNLSLDIGGNSSSGAWLQATNRIDLSQEFPLLLNPNGGNVGISTTTTQSYSRLEVNTTGSGAIVTMDQVNGGLLIGYQGPSIQGRTTAHGNGNLSLNNFGGNVIVGATASVGAKFEVQGGSASAGYFQSSTDAPVTIRGTDAWSGISFIDSSGSDSIWYNGSNSTFAIGGGGASVSGKKLHVDGGMTVGSGYDAGATPTNGLLAQGNVNTDANFNTAGHIRFNGWGYIDSNSSGLQLRGAGGTVGGYIYDTQQWLTGVTSLNRGGSGCSYGVCVGGVLNTESTVLANDKITVTGGATGNSGIANSAGSLGEAEFQGNGTGAAMITFHRPGSYATYFGLDTDNQLKWGGWSAGSVAYTILSTANMNISQFTNNSGYITDGNTNWDNSYGYITDGNTNWDNSYGYYSSGSAPTFNSVTINDGYELYFANNGQIRSGDNNHRILMTNGSNQLELREYGSIILSSGATSGTQTATGVLDASGNWSVSGSSCASSWSNWPCLDIAELYDTTDVTLDAGHLVETDPTNPVGIRKAQGGTVIGVISTQPAILLSGTKVITGGPSATSTEGKMAVALAGHVPVWVSDEAGQVMIGDKIALSSVAGVGRKAVFGEDTVGVAMEMATTSLGMIQVYVNLDHGMNSSQFAIDASGNVGIGTSTPAYKLHVLGDVAAQSFINISTRESKKEIEYLDEEAKSSILDEIKSVGVATYRYNTEDESDALHLGLIAEEAPSEVLATGGKGVDVYKLSTFVLAGVQELAGRFESIESRIALTEEGIASLTGTLASTTAQLASTTADVAAARAEIEALKVQIANLNVAAPGSQTVTWSSADLTAAVTAYFDSLGVKLVNGVTTITKGFVETFSATVATIKQATVESLSADALTISNPEKRGGITLYDEVSGEPYCLRVSNGTTVTSAGICSSGPYTGNTSGVSFEPPAATSTPTTSPEVVVEPAPEPEATTTPEVVIEPAPTTTPAVVVEVVPAEEPSPEPAVEEVSAEETAGEAESEEVPTVVIEDAPQQ